MEVDIRSVGVRPHWGALVGSVKGIPLGSVSRHTYIELNAPDLLIARIYQCCRSPESA